jgi:hypothetical protein
VSSATQLRVSDVPVLAEHMDWPTCAEDGVPETELGRKSGLQQVGVPMDLYKKVPNQCPNQGNNMGARLGPSRMMKIPKRE